MCNSNYCTLLRAATHSEKLWFSFKSGDIIRKARQITAIKQAEDSIYTSAGKLNSIGVTVSIYQVYLHCFLPESRLIKLKPNTFITLALPQGLLMPCEWLQRSAPGARNENSKSKASAEKFIPLITTHSI